MHAQNTQLFMRMGLPQVVTTDQGREFNNHLNKEMMTALNINHRLTTAYHPQVYLHLSKHVITSALILQEF